MFIVIWKSTYCSSVLIFSSKFLRKDILLFQKRQKKCLIFYSNPAKQLMPSGLRLDFFLSSYGLHRCMLRVLNSPSPISHKTDS